jgi:hypothetical protein
MLPTLKTCHCRIVLLQNADQVLEPLHHFSFFFINANYFYGGVGWMIRQLQQLRWG